MTTEIKIEIKNKNKMLANANVLIDTVEFGQVNIKAFQIWQSNYLNLRLGEYINIAPPSLRYFKFIFFEDEKSWLRLEKQIWESYKNKVAENTPINPDDVEKIFKS
jgi:hypothetical protein